MRWTVFSCLVACGIVLSGCGDGGSAPTAAAPAPPGGPPSGPPMPGGDYTPPPSSTPGDGAPGDGLPTPQALGNGLPTPQALGGTPPPAEYAPPPTGTPDGVPPPGEPGNPNGGNPNGGNPIGGEPGDGNPDGTPRRPPPPRTLREASFAAFRAGNDMLGYKLLNAHFAVVPAAKDELAQKMAWVPGLMRPALAPRIGIAVQYLDIPLNFKGDPMPIGSAALTAAVAALQQAEAADSRIGGTGRTSKYGRGMRGATADFSEKSRGDPVANYPAATQLSYYLGDFGEWLLEALQERMETGEYGPVLQELVQLAPPMPRGRGGQPGEGQPSGDTAAGGGPGSEDGGPPGSGQGGGRFAGGGRRGGGAGGSAFGGSADGIPGVAGDAGAPGDNRPRRWSTKATDKEAVNLAQLKQLSPFIVWLGKAEERDEIVKRAEAANVDILAIFSMTLHEARTGNFVNNTSTLRIQNLRTQKPLANYSAEPLVNLTVERWRQKDEKGIDPVKREVLKAIEALDKVLKPVPLPETVTAEIAKKRIAYLVSQKPDEPLPVIVEARYFMAKGLMSEDEFSQTAKTLLGADGFAKLAARSKEGEQ